MFGSLQFLAFLNFLLFLTTSLSICPFHINLDWRKGLCGTKARIGKCWGWVWLWESVVLCMHMVSECCTFWIPQLLTHLSLPGKCGINSQCQAVFWLLAAAATLCACCLLAPEWLSASSSCFSSSSFLSPSAGHLSHCSVYNTLILDLVSSCFHQFLPALEVQDDFNSGPCVQSSTSAKITGKDFLLWSFPSSGELISSQLLIFVQ